MRKTSHSRPTPSLPYVVAGCALLLIILLLLWRGVFAGLLWRAATPVLEHNPLRAVSAALQSKAALSAENESLRAELASTSATLADRDLLYQENLELKARLGRDASVRTTLAGILLRPPATPYDTLIIDAGSEDGVVKGALVSAGGTTLIGQIDAVYDTTARVVLFSAPGETYQALLMESASHGTVPVAVEGQGGGSLKTEVPANTQAAIGDAVVFPGVAGGLQSFVVAVEQHSGESFETLYLRLPVNIESLRFVEVLQHSL